ncbi:restriction endonuclease subunit S [Flavobacterium branchiarum]|uniref:Restriction endonuclease subunit S n=1 Tax=Flavobacterium branchiarum TaxID=1114870 RepID=A0ABV5FIQ7_9FLAO|nr:restriction endonuclease subunit S [Flavobacterium branchiarum]MDN3675109.1 restriction endonuclease subunit S [Flavobacterium branchiarum]
MIKYDKYKSSEIDWLGDIPNDWDIKRVKDLAKTKSGTTPHSQTKKYYSEGIHNWVRTTDLNDGELYEVEYKITDIALEECNMTFLPIDTILVAMYGGFGTIGKNSILKKVSTINQSVCAILPSNKLNSEYFFYFLKFFRSSWKIFADGTRKDPNINQEAIKNLFIYFPKVEEQKEIVTFLNNKTQAIDKKINLLTQKANYYKEYRKSLINKTVCKGLDKNVKFKDSNINYINDIPEHWKIERIKDLFYIGRGRVIGQELLVEQGKYPVYSSQTENNGCLGFIETYDFDNDLLTWTTDGANAGTVFRRSGKFNCTNVCGTLIPKRRNLDLDYVVYALQESATHNKRIDTNGAKIMNNEMAVINIAFPPLKEQTKIANYLDNKTQTIDKIVSNINTQMQTLKELRKTLINDAVTGKINVTKD